VRAFVLFEKILGVCSTRSCHIGRAVSSDYCIDVFLYISLPGGVVVVFAPSGVLRSLHAVLHMLRYRSRYTGISPPLERARTLPECQYQASTIPAYTIHLSFCRVARNAFDIPDAQEQQHRTRCCRRVYERGVRVDCLDELVQQAGTTRTVSCPAALSTYRRASESLHPAHAECTSARILFGNSTDVSNSAVQ